MGILYALSNEAMPGLIKCGVTTRADVRRRMKELYSTGVPLPFELIDALEASDDVISKLETLLFATFGPARKNLNREFLFHVSVRQVQAFFDACITAGQGGISRIELGVVKEALDDAVVEEDVQALAAAKRKRPRLRFADLGIGPGETLLLNGGSQAARVAGEGQVEYEGQVHAFINLTRTLLGKPADYPVRPADYWTWNGRWLSDLYDEFHSAAHVE